MYRCVILGASRYVCSTQITYTHRESVMCAPKPPQEGGRRSGEPAWPSPQRGRVSVGTLSAEDKGRLARGGAQTLHLTRGSACSRQGLCEAGETNETGVAKLTHASTEVPQVGKHLDRSRERAAGVLHRKTGHSWLKYWKG